MQHAVVGADVQHWRTATLATRAGSPEGRVAVGGIATGRCARVPDVGINNVPQTGVALAEYDSAFAPNANELRTVSIALEPPGASPN